MSKLNKFKLSIKEGLNIKDIIATAVDNDVIEKINLENSLNVFIEKASTFVNGCTIKLYMIDGTNFTTVDDIVKCACESNSDDAINYFEDKFNTLSMSTKATIVVTPDGFTISKTIPKDGFVPKDLTEGLLIDGRVIQSKVFEITAIANELNTQSEMVQGLTNDYGWAINEVSNPTYDKIKKLIEEIDFEECINYNIETKGHVFETIEEYR